MIVVDASVLANVVGDDGDDGGVARARLRAEAEVAVPDLADVDTVAVLRRRWLTGDLTDERFELRANVTAYDAMYVGLAEHFDCLLVTGDARLAEPPGVRCTVDVLIAA